MCRFGGAGVRLRNRGKTESRAVEYCASARLSAAYDSDITHTQGSNSASGGARASAVQVASQGAACAQVQQGGVFGFAARHGLREQSSIGDCFPAFGPLSDLGAESVMQCGAQNA